MHCTSRKQRGMSERIMLIEHNKIDFGYKFLVIGSSSKSYDLILTTIEKPSCTCMDYKMRKYNCKHLYFLFNKILRLDNPDKWNTFSIETITQKIQEIDIRLDLLNYTYKDININNDECGICLNEFEEIEKISKCPTCNNGIHAICWTKYINFTKKEICIYCRNIY